jgi:hypothetical protein
MNFFHRFDHQELFMELHLNLHLSATGSPGFNVVLELFSVDSNCVGVMAYCRMVRVNFSLRRDETTPYCTGVLERRRVHSNE